MRHNKSHVCPYDEDAAPAEAVAAGPEVRPGACSSDKAIMGIFDEGCMGMYNAIIPDDLLHKTGVYKERLSQSALYAKMQTVSDAEAQAVYQWLRDKGMTFQFGPDEADRSDRSAGAGPVQNVHRRRAHRRRVRLRDDRHSVPAGPERSGPGLRPGGRIC